MVKCKLAFFVRMAMNVVIPLLIPLEENLYNSTRLASGPDVSFVEFSQTRYCASLSEDSPHGASVATVFASHSDDEDVRYSITGGNRDGLFTIDQHSGVITLAAALDYEVLDKHELVVVAEAAGEVAHTRVRVRVRDVNDNPPYFLDPRPYVTLVEEDDRSLPASIITVTAEDPDWLDHHGLLYTVRGDGVDGFHPDNAFFSVNSLTGEVIQLRPLDRDPPAGRAVWRVRVQVRDGQALWSREAIHRHLASKDTARRKEKEKDAKKTTRNSHRKRDYMSGRGDVSSSSAPSAKEGGRARVNSVLSRHRTEALTREHFGADSGKTISSLIRGKDNYFDIEKKTYFDVMVNAEPRCAPSMSNCQNNLTSQTYSGKGEAPNTRGVARKSHRLLRRYRGKVKAWRQKHMAGTSTMWRVRRFMEEEAEGGEELNKCDDSIDNEGDLPDEEDLHGLGSSRVHVAETVVTLTLKDINDNAPEFPNATMYGQVQENGPIDLSVAVVVARDADDALEGDNARVTYSIQKNAFHETTGDPIFTINSETGLVRTATCCLDRETTPQYQVLVAAMDGGGLRGTGVLVVRLTDVNDNSPQLEQKQWEVEVDETWGAGPPDNVSLLEVSVLDVDTSNYFFYRVVEDSGWGWQLFSVRSVGAVGELYALQTLDYEDETHRRGFKFMVQVTDRGRGGWDDSRHVDTAWVSVHLKDVNDNPPQFSRTHAHVKVREDAALGTLLASIPAHDPDMGGEQKVQYHVEGGWDVLAVNAVGGIILRGALDREGPGGTIGVAKILGVDRGIPPLTATATLTITLTDVNDSPPLLLPPVTFHVTEDAAPARLGVLTATDEDVWALGHGPPFTFSLASSNPQYIFDLMSLQFDPHLDSGRGGAELWTRSAVDREEHPQLVAAVRVADARGLAATHPVTVIINDINDNPMKPAAKTTYLWRTQRGGAEAPLGRVFVQDPDDGDVADKTFCWEGSPHPLFTLDSHTGDLLASSHIREGKYDLHFSVSDQRWGHHDVSANVTVEVQMLSVEALSHATRITLTPTTPERLARGWNPHKGGGGLGRLVTGVAKAMGTNANSVEVVSVHSCPQPRTSSRRRAVASTSSLSTCVWMSVQEAHGTYMNPIKFQGLLALHSVQVEAMTNLTILTEGPSIAAEGDVEHFMHHFSLPSFHNNGAPDPSSAASTTLPLQVVDTNSTSLVTPRLSRSHDCLVPESGTCLSVPCLNGGRCFGSHLEKRCICPGDSWGPRCKVLSRTFTGSGWMWVRPLPLCLPTTISLRILTRQTHSLILYSGPLGSHQRQSNNSPTPMLALQLWEGHPQLLVEGGLEPIKLGVNAVVNDGEWHTIHLRFNYKGVVLAVHPCGNGWLSASQDDDQCMASVSWTSPFNIKAWLASWPLQVGGLAHTTPSAAYHSWKEAPTPNPLDGCVSHLTLNGQLVDLGEPAYSKGSQKGCRPQESACPTNCGYKGWCEGGFNHPYCDCQPGWMGHGCSTPTTTYALGPHSSVSMALSFTLVPESLTMQVRIRTTDLNSRLLLLLSLPQEEVNFSIYLRSGLACATVSGMGQELNTVCVEGRPVGDGAWHTIKAEHHGHYLVVAVDDGDGWRRNESVGRLLADKQVQPLSLFEEDQQELHLVVGNPLEQSEDDYVSILNLSTVCLDDLRVSGKQLQLPPTVNSTSWGYVTTWQGIEPGCPAPNACSNTTCTPPLTCISSWDTPTCRCKSGQQLLGHSCEDINECLWQPCLHGGTCHNLQPGFRCICEPGHSGEFCQWTELPPVGSALTAPLVIAAISLSVLFLVVLALLVSLRLRHHRLMRASAQQGDKKDTITEIPESSTEELDTSTDHQLAVIECIELTPNTKKGNKHKSCMETAMVTAAPATAVTPGRPVNVLPDATPAKDDLRAYAYEGDGSSAGSLSSALAGLKEEPPDEDTIKPLVTDFLEVMDLLKNLPEASRSPSLARPQVLVGGEDTKDTVGQE
ncbi:putative neural-cadherin 2 isoform X1 [Portunus trituberculatus]|uniref:putative neural-cadherin 2 isoform X1 n=1 Tax=Portunus trituberculatus TaxID=210409 RepID=UPI001E1D1B1D|nr:putative neural-cadherin 2 isoform X1 [Portunus trituberculatus]XP_045130295.1 putative neural-cadherin 2 isoform X1 [Portunus trituberculatus]XP_045130296.1 putative neural-cadherin 2 isoform X1 [Portunus trituberculatus]